MPLKGDVFIGETTAGGETTLANSAEEIYEDSVCIFPIICKF